MNVEADEDLSDVPMEFGGELDVSPGTWLFEGAGAYSPGGCDSESHGAVQEDKWQRYMLDARGLAAYAPAAGPFNFGAEYRFTRTAYDPAVAFRAGNTFYDRDEDTDFDRHRILATAGYRRPLASRLGLAVRAGAGMAYLTQNTELESKEYDYTTGTETTTTTMSNFGTAWLPA